MQMQNWQLGHGSFWGSLSHPWQWERHSPRTVSFDSPSNKWKITQPSYPAEACAHSSMHPLQHLEPPYASKMQAAYFPAAQSDRSPLLEKVHWKAAVVTPTLFHTADFSKSHPFIAKCERSRREIESDVPKSGSPNRSEMTHVQLLFSLFPWALAMCQALCKAQISGHPSFNAFTAPREMERVA